MSERILPVNGIDLCVDTFGHPTHPAILLIAGMSQSMDSWEDDFCERLAAGLRYVVRYDQRDTGRTTTCPAGTPDYTADDLVEDAAGLLDALDVDQAHVVGISMGGAMAQLLALRHPRCVATLTLMSTSPVTPMPDGSVLPPIGRDLPAPPPEPDWSDRAAVVDYLVEANRGYVPHGFDERRFRALAERVVARTPDVRPGMTNHALLADGEPQHQRVCDITAPTLVIHGTADPVFPLPHGEAFERAIPGASLLVLDGVGHEVPPPRTWDTVVPALLRLSSGSWEAQELRILARAQERGDATGWFEELYAAGAAGEVELPWSRTDPHPLLVEWANGLDGSGRRAVVVGCGLGADAAYVAGLGFDTIGFDVSATAVRLAAERFPDVTFRVADLLDLPEEWRGAFDLVVEIITVQALPDDLRPAAIAGVRSLVAPGGTLLVVALRDDPTLPPDPPPPTPLTRAEIDAFARDGLTEVRVEELVLRTPRWRAELTRPAAAGDAPR